MSIEAIIEKLAEKTRSLVSFKREHELTYVFGCRHSSIIVFKKDFRVKLKRENDKNYHNIGYLQ